MAAKALQPGGCGAGGRSPAAGGGGAGAAAATSTAVATAAIFDRGAQGGCEGGCIKKEGPGPPHGPRAHRGARGPAPRSSRCALANRPALLFRPPQVWRARGLQPAGFADAANCSRKDARFVEGREVWLRSHRRPIPRFCCYFPASLTSTRWPWRRFSADHRRYRHCAGGADAANVDGRGHGGGNGHHDEFQHGGGATRGAMPTADVLGCGSAAATQVFRRPTRRPRWAVWRGRVKTDGGGVCGGAVRGERCSSGRDSRPSLDPLPPPGPPPPCSTPSTGCHWTLALRRAGSRRRRRESFSAQRWLWMRLFSAARWRSRPSHAGRD